MVTAVDAHEIKIKKSGRVIWGRCAELTFEVINGIVVRGKDEKFGTLFVEADGAGGKVRDDSQNTDDSVNSQSSGVGGCACRGKIETLGLLRVDPHSARIPHCCLRGGGDVGNGLPPG